MMKAIYKSKVFVIGLISLALSSGCLQRASILGSNSSSESTSNSSSFSTLSVYQGSPFGKQYGTTGIDALYGIAPYNNGGVVVVGQTNGNFLETVGGTGDIIMARWDELGNLIWQKQWGTTTLSTASSGIDTPSAVTVSSQGNIYVTGYTNGPLAEANGGSNDIFIAKVSPADGSIFWARQLGGISAGTNSSLADLSRAIDTDNNENIYIAGYTAGTLGGATLGGNDAYVAKFNSSGALMWESHFGGTGSDLLTTIAVDRNTGEVYVAGTTTSMLTESVGGTDAFIAKISSSGGAPVWIRQLGAATISGGSTGTENVGGMTLATSIGKVFITGSTNAALYESSGGSQDVFITCIDTSSGSHVWGRQLGLVTVGASSSASDLGIGISFHPLSNTLVVGGSTTGSLGGANIGLGDLYSVRTDMTGTPIAWTHSGTAGTEAVNAFISVENGFSYFAGSTNTTWFSTFIGGTSDVLAVKTYNP